MGKKFRMYTVECGKIRESKVLADSPKEALEKVLRHYGIKYTISDGIGVSDRNAVVAVVHLLQGCRESKNYYKVLM